MVPDFALILTGILISLPIILMGVAVAIATEKVMKATFPDSDKDWFVLSFFTGVFWPVTVALVILGMTGTLIYRMFARIFNSKFIFWFERLTDNMSGWVTRFFKVKMTHDFREEMIGDIISGIKLLSKSPRICPVFGDYEGYYYKIRNSFISYDVLDSSKFCYIGINSDELLKVARDFPKVMVFNEYGECRDIRALDDKNLLRVYRTLDKEITGKMKS